MKLLDHCSSIWICWTINLDLCLSNLFKLTYNIKKEWSQCYRKGQGQQIGIWLISYNLYGSLKLYGNLVKCIKNKIFMWKSLGRSGSENYDTFQLLPLKQVTLKFDEIILTSKQQAKHRVRMMDRRQDGRQKDSRWTWLQFVKDTVDKAVFALFVLLSVDKLETRKI